MIDQLKEEIKNIERILNNKKEQLNKLLDEASLHEDNDKLIVFVETHDRFSGITDIELIADNETAINTLKVKYDKGSCSYDLYMFRSKTINEDFKHVKELNTLSNQSYLYKWMEENNEKLINAED